MSACLQPAASLGPQRNSYGRKATVLTSQIPVDHWHEIVGDATFGDAILDRLLHNAHRITLKGGSMRRVYDSTKDAATPHTSTD